MCLSWCPHEFQTLAAWQWFIHYGLGSGRTGGSYNLQKTGVTVGFPYFQLLSQDGGPGNCDTSNSDGWTFKDWKIWVK